METFTHNYNGYLTGQNRLTANAANDVILTSAPAYSTSTLGRWYLDSTTPTLLNVGSRTAPNAGLYHFTKTTNQAKETTSQVDIGFHYAAVDGNGNPVDGDNDGLADYLEDTNGNGSYGTGDLADLGATDTDGDGMSDGWEWKNFGDFTRNGNDDYDDDQQSDAAEFYAQTDPNTISALLQFNSLWVSSTSVTGSVEELAGHPAQIAILVESTNFSGAVWRSYNSNFTVNLIPTDGVQKVWVGLRGRTESSEQSWNCVNIVLDRIPPMLVITNPVAATGSVPMIQLQGYCSEALDSFSFDVTNAAGLLTNQQGFVSSQFYDASLHAFTTNYFQCFDIDLTNGVNIVTLKATDLAGNVTVTNYSFTLDYTSKTNPPVVQLFWPLNGMQIGGASFTLKGIVEDPTVIVTAQIVNSSGETNAASGLVERNGKFWVEDIPLSTGTNVLTLTATDVVGNTSVTNINLSPSGVVITMDAVTPDSQLWQPTVNLNGTISSPNYAVWVNGVKGVNNGDSTWTANNVPVNKGGTATFEVIAYAPDEQQPDGSYGN